MHVLDRAAYDSFTDGLLLLDTIRSLYPEEFQFVRWSEKSPYSIDLLLGTDEYRTGALTAQGLDGQIRAQGTGICGDRQAVPAVLIRLTSYIFNQEDFFS